MAGRNLELEARMRQQLEAAIMARGGGQSGMLNIPNMAAIQTMQNIPGIPNRQMGAGLSETDAQFLYLMTQSPEAMLHSQMASASNPALQNYQNIRPIIPMNQQFPQISQIPPYMMNSGGYGQLGNYPYMPNMGYLPPYAYQMMQQQYGAANSIYPFAAMYPRGGFPIK
ncbi:unnamed protein product, partial [Mesorhabditis spiculigera]